MSHALPTIDLTRLPAPDVVEELSYEIILDQWKNTFRDHWTGTEDAPMLDLESDPVVKLLEAGAYRELLLRQRINDSARAVMLAYAVGSDLDNLAALTPAVRKVIHPGDPKAVPLVPPVLESDDEFRRRLQMAPESFSVAGPEGAYLYAALKVPGCRDASVTSPDPCKVEVTVLGREGDGTPSDAVVQAVRDTLAHGDVRPLTDEVTVKKATILPYTVHATLAFYDGPDTQVAIEAARDAVTEYARVHHRLGDGITLSGIYAALHQPGVRKVTLMSPTADIPALAHQATYCTALEVDA
ncbi:baseplate assembly protein [Desulfoluna spongiiphila]|uniref:Phage-related baseplate assembly protein n=1 Tax=Desulfoluna spongiiphila TaxID=419481 RepID=A0A1G5ACT9_9BACT|nr:baseplate J/gp47 family protein [Desulfoluna spongiiphila]SCX75668.1 Phage-related baseplate assembly protein [Desulfoluna spongiiphila]